MSNQQTYTIKMDPSIIMEASQDEEDDILYQPMEETVYVLDNCVIPTAEIKTEKTTPVKAKVVLQKKPTKAALKRQQKQQQQRDLLEECVQDIEECEEVVTSPSHHMVPASSLHLVPASSHHLVPKVEKPVTPVRVAPKIMLKSDCNTLTKKDCELIKDCVESLADQDCVETFKLRTRVEHLCKAEWWKIADIIVRLMHQYLPENGVEVIDHTHIEQARYQMKETYKWAGYVVGKDFTYSERIRSIKQDSCYEAMRKRNNDMRPRKAISKRTSAQYSVNKKMRLANSYGVLVFEDLDEGKISSQRRSLYKVFCDELLRLPVGHQFTSQQIELANSYSDILMASLRNADPNQFHAFQATGGLGLLRHIRLYLNFVRKITKREDTVIHKFQENCDLYLLCLEDLLKSFPPADIFDVKTLDIKSSPYISLVKIIASQLGRKASFIIDPEVSTEVSIDETGPICLVKNGNYYDLWINGVVVVPHMQEIQAIFCLGTAEDVFCISQKSSTDSSDVIEFMRKYLLLIPDFHMKRPKPNLLGQGFCCFTELYKIKMGGNPKPTKFLCYETAMEAINALL